MPIMLAESVARLSTNSSFRVGASDLTQSVRASLHPGRARFFCSAEGGDVNTESNISIWPLFQLFNIPREVGLCEFE